MVEALEGRVFLSASPASASSASSHTVTPADTAPSGNQPMVTSASPAPGATNVPLDSFVSCEVFVPNGGIDPSSLTPDTAYLVLSSQNRRIGVNVKTSGGGDVILVSPTTPLQSQTVYTFVVTSGVKDVSGAAFAPFQMTFTTGNTTTQLDPRFAGVNFVQAIQQKSVGQAGTRA